LTDVCTLSIQNRGVSQTGLSALSAASIPESASKWSCDLNNRVVKTPGASYVIQGGTRHWIPDAWTFYHWSRILPVVNASSEAQIKRISDGGNLTPALDAVDVPSNTIIRRADGVSWVVGSDRVRHHIPYARDDACWRDLNGYRVVATGLTAAQSAVIPEGGVAGCVVGNRVVQSSDGRSYFVDTSNVRHWIPNTETFAALSHRYQVVGPWPAGDVNSFIPGSDQPVLLDPNPLFNSILCRNDGVCWVVDGGGTRHWIPSTGDNVCLRVYQGYQIKRWADGSLTGTLPEGGATGCSMDNTVIYSNADYFMSGNTRRWIQDAYSWDCYHEGRAAHGMSWADASSLPEGAAMPKCLSPNVVKGKVVTASDGTAYYVDGNGWWHWIPGSAWNCVTAKHPFYARGLPWAQINTARNGRDAGLDWATCAS
jgi:hypothetical protein